MWKAYLHVIKEKTPQAINVLDKFHIMQKFSKALDEIRAQEVKRLKAEGKEPVLKHARWCILKRTFNLTKSQRGQLNELIEMNLNMRFVRRVKIGISNNKGLEICTFIQYGFKAHYFLFFSKKR